jgi:hypothetical protein
MVEVTWMQSYLAYMLNKTLPEDVVETRNIVRCSKAFVVVQGKLYKKSISDVLQRCVTLKKDKSYCKTSTWEFVVIMPAATQETPFFLVHSVEVMLPVKITHEAPRIMTYDESTSNEHRPQVGLIR